MRSMVKQAWGIGMILLGLGACVGETPLVGSDGSGVGTPVTNGSAGNPSSGAPAAGGADEPRSLAFIPMAAQPGDPDPRPYQCLPVPLNESDCQILTTRKGAACDCQEPGLVPSTASLTDAIRRYLQTSGQCDIGSRPACSSFCACEYPKAIGESLIECKTEPEASPESMGWCYVSADGGERQAELVADCPAPQPQRLRFMGNQSLLAATFDETGALDVYAFLSCTGTLAPRKLGEVCAIGVVGDVHEVNVADRFAGCTSGICVANHFQGLVSCPYGQIAGAGDCSLPNSPLPFPNAVKPQLVERQAAVASICSCQCAGTGPGPYCTCPESMQCEHLVDDLHLASNGLAGSYCIPKGSEYYADQQAECVEPNCGAKHPY